MLAVGIIMLIVAALLLIVGGLAATGHLPGNNVIGLRLIEIRKSRAAWDNAHKVAGLFWVLSGVALLFGGIVALNASGWMWLLPAAMVIVSILALSVGSNMGSRAAYLFDQAHKEEEEGCGDSCNCGDSCDSGSDTPAVEVNLGALRQAAQKSDKK
ncbi:SdpI family protein [Corynebacterium flavescens]|uniref:SdpI family protein n=1 Tax=Corynebacterium flavescens TaxID=28028 RepID=UPI0028977FC7|nr:SdpI family protein [Corynebacterium flavescens]